MSDSADAFRYAVEPWLTTYAKCRAQDEERALGAVRRPLPPLKPSSPGVFCIGWDPGIESGSVAFYAPRDCPEVKP